MASFFQEVSDDSISVNSTDPGDPDKEYPIEHILAEDVAWDTGEVQYLIKWEGYNILESSWEPAWQIATGQDLVLAAWRERQRKVAKGELEAFDLDAFNREKNKVVEEKEQRAARRKLKRKKQGLSVSPSPSPEPQLEAQPDDDDGDWSDGDRQSPEEVRSKRAPQARPKRKGIAQPVKNTRPSKVLSIDSSSDSSSSDELSKQPVVERSKPSQKVQPPKQRPQPAKLDTQSASAATKPRQNGSLSAQAKTPQTPQTAVTTPTVASNARTTATQAPAVPKPKPTAPPTASSVGTGRRTSNTAMNVMGNWNAEPKRRNKRTESSTDPREMRFASTSEENRFRKHGRDYEPPTDSSRLATIDPKTGRLEPPKNPVPAAVVSASKATPANAQFAQPMAPVAPTPLSMAAVAPTVPSMVAPRVAASPVIAPVSRTATTNTGSSLSAPSRPAAIAPPPAVPTNLESARTMSALMGSMTAPKNRPGDIHSAYSRRTPGQAERQRSPSPPRSPPRGPSLAGNARPELVGRATCRRWAEGFCQFGQNCWYAHYDTTANPTPMAYSATANYTPKIPEGPKNPTVPKGPHDPRKDVAFRVTSNQIPKFPEGPKNLKNSTFPRVPYHKRKDTTCYFWQTGYCRYSTDCDFAHHDTGVYAEQPGRKKDTQNSTLLASCSNAQEILGPSFLTSPATVRTPVERYTEQGAAFMHHALDDPAPAPMPQSTVQDQAPTPVFSNEIPFKIVIERGSERDTTKAQVRFAFGRATGLSRLKSLLSQSETHELEVMTGVGAADLQRFGAEIIDGARSDNEWPVGKLVSNPHMPALEEFAKLCRLQSSGGLAYTKHFTLCVFPADSPDWHFLANPDMAFVPEAPLTFRILPPLAEEIWQRPQFQEMQVLPRVSASETSAAVIGKHILGLDIDRLLTVSEEKGKCRNVFVMVPFDRLVELEMIVGFFRSHDCTVSSSAEPGAWETFRSESLLVVHSDVQLWKIPNLAQHLNEGANLRVFRIGEDPNDSIFKCERLFAGGEATFITDDVFVYRPETAVEIIRTFLKSMKSRELGSRRIVTRPGVKDWLMNLAMERNGRGRSDPNGLTYMELYKAICELSPPEFEDPWDRPNPLPIAHLVSPPAEFLPSFDGWWERDEEGSTDAMVNWFAGWAVGEASSYRRFNLCNEVKGTERVVVGDNGVPVMQPGISDPKGWSKMYTHLAFVTPDECLRKIKSGMRQSMSK